MPLVHIHDGNWQRFVEDPVVDGEVRRRGLIPRDYGANPVGSYRGSRAVDMPTIPQSDWSGLLKGMTDNLSRLSDLRNAGMGGMPIPSRDQNGKGYCWAHSSTSALLLLRARDNAPYADLSAYAIACIIKGYRDEGGWGAQSMDWIIENGCPTSKFWPQQSMSRSNDTPEMRADAKLHRVSEGFWDLQAPQYNRNLSFAQVATCLLCRIPVVVDYNWWGHSVCAADLVEGTSLRRETRADSGKLATTAEFDAIWATNDPVMAGFGVRIWNSWGDSWSENGMGVLSGTKAVPNGSVAPRVAFASAA